uniref:Uncharacterized protein n=1 Tax=Bradyrhizobium japonicum TaxID=375 RepID=Q45273_BRAJP|nr:unknown protein [Bradyrhizobium japonicum]
MATMPRRTISSALPPRQATRGPLAAAAGEGAGGRAVAAAGAGRLVRVGGRLPGSVRRPVGSGTACRQCGGCGQGHERGRSRHHDQRHGRSAGDAAEDQWRRRRGLAAAGPPIS